MNETLQKWHRVVEQKDIAALDSLLADDCVFHSPVVHTAQQGKTVSKLYLAAAATVLANDTFRYVRHVVDGSQAVLEFEAEIGGTHINGVDMIRWDADGRIVDFKVMVRPLKAIHLLHDLMRQMLEQMSGKRS